MLGEKSSGLAVQAGGQRPGARTEVWVSQHRHDRGSEVDYAQGCEAEGIAGWRTQQPQKKFKCVQNGGERRVDATASREPSSLAAAPRTCLTKGKSTTFQLCPQNSTGACPVASTHSACASGQDCACEVGPAWGLLTEPHSIDDATCPHPTSFCTNPRRVPANSGRVGAERVHPTQCIHCVQTCCVGTTGCQKTRHRRKETE